MVQLQCLNKISINGNKYLLKGNLKAINAILRKIIADHHLQLNTLEVNLITDDELLKINQESLSHDYYTDIITFDYSEGKIITGDIYISIDRVKENAGIFKTTSFNELLRVIIHGALHLSGYKDKTKKDKTEMTKMENKYLFVFTKGFS